MPGIIEDHEERLKVLEAARRGVHGEISARLTQFENDLGGQARRLTTMETHHTGLQHNEIEALGRRVHAVEVRSVEKLDSIAAAQEVLGVDTRAWIDEVKADLRREVDAAKRALSYDILMLQEAQSKTNTNSRDLKRRVEVWESWHERQEAWNALPWWRRWWKRLRGERP